MKMTRILIASMLLAAGGARAAEYPEKPIRVVLPQGPAGGADLVVRNLAPVLQQLLKQPIVVENKPGGNEAIAADAVAKALPDGYTVGLISSTFSINQLGIGAKLPYDSQKDFVPVASLVRVPMAVLVYSELGVTDMKALVQLSGSRPGQLNYVSLGPTTFQGLATEWLKKTSGADLTTIAYGGKGTLQALMGGEVQVGLLGFGAATPALQSGKVKAIAVTSKTRMKTAPNVPAVAESFPGYEVTPWYGIVAPAGTPPAAIKRLHEAFNEAMSSADIVEKLGQLGMEPTPMSVAEFQSHLAHDLASWKQIAAQLPPAKP